MAKLTEKELEAISKIVEEEFPDGPAMQQVHIARKILAREAEKEGLTLIEYIKSLGKKRNQLNTIKFPPPVGGD